METLPIHYKDYIGRTWQNQLAGQLLQRAQNALPRRITGCQAMNNEYQRLVLDLYLIWC